MEIAAVKMEEIVTAKLNHIEKEVVKEVYDAYFFYNLEKGIGQVVDIYI